MTQPYWAAGVDPAVREIPGEVARAEPPLTWAQLTATVQFFLDTFIGQIAIAFGGISIFGWRPLDFLADWGQARVEEAQENYLLALNAQNTATFTSGQLAAITGAGLASDVSGGIAINAGFSEASATTLTGFTRVRSDGPGAGTFGPDGAGNAVWKKSGGLWRRHLDLHDTELATDYQIVTAVLAAPPQEAYLGQQAYTYLIARCDDVAENFVWLRIGRAGVVIGKSTTADLWEASGAWASASVTTRAGDQWSLLAGTDTDDRQFLVKQNGVVRLDHTDTTSSSMGADYRYVGLASLAADRGVLIIPLLDQTVPAQLDAWAAADRLSTSI